MVTFNCEVCNATVPKKNTEKHYYRCPNAYYTCIDCSKTFDDGYSYQKHTECITEDEKYQKGLYKGNGKVKKAKGKVTKPEAKPEATPKEKLEENPKEKTVVTAKETPVLKKGENLYKILKNIKDKDAKKKLLKSLIVNSDGNLTLASI
ncbi:hypothetical protein TBLA_0F00540 [Henningerozyma blattae CBS 6284]|uniref:C2H2-type domain-containing protein n=1 Tax=Henningerozyma blattae (strain ATCC 34711 / CBS 6284 / DSM 70876 / NBRC 10599 / NRRL Y-10934 / UCD 77-7) TaxID=1071380 RepID=I2H5E6_HENB6|nr:hypothetical protein TBLA_0F00540 [Tetrapisispora blattae CBS 6284]CCH61598.1 hypothetical protein TBLA_0F00540 [Tetrapisispora blattae CBS 6284]